jgi:hypothetical protein
VLGGHRRHRRGGHDVGDDRQLLGSRLGLGHEPFGDLGGGRQQQHPSRNPVQPVQAELEPRGHAEVAAAAADGPEQVGMRPVVELEDPSVGGDQLGREQAVDGQAPLADQEPDPAAQGQPADPTEAVSAKPVTSPWAAAAVVYRPAVRPAPAHAVRCSTSRSSWSRLVRSRTMPPSLVILPGERCP